MITKRQANKILSLFNSGDEINILLALELIKSLDAYKAISLYSDEYMGNLSLQNFDVMDALYAYKGVKKHETIISILEIWDNLTESIEENTSMRRKTFNILLSMLDLEHHYSDTVPDNNIKLVITQNNDQYELWLKENWYLKNLSTLLPYIRFGNSIMHDPIALKAQYGTTLVGGGFCHNPNEQKLDVIDIVRKSGSKVKYALFPAWQPDQVTFVIKTSVKSPPPKND